MKRKSKKMTSEKQRQYDELKRIHRRGKKFVKNSLNYWSERNAQHIKEKESV